MSNIGISMARPVNIHQQSEETLSFCPRKRDREWLINVQLAV